MLSPSDALGLFRFWIPSGLIGVHFICTMLVGLSADHKVAFQGYHRVSDSERVVAGAFLFKDAVGLFKLWRVAVGLFVEAVQPFVPHDNPPLLFDFRIAVVIFLVR